VDSLSEVDTVLRKLWDQSLTPHLFITTSHDADSLRTIDPASWRHRRFEALEVPYRVCQLWMQQMIDAGRMDIASLVLATNLGGDFGLSGRTGLSPEGGLSGLVKAMLIESWMRGYRSTPMKVIDLHPRTTSEQAAEQIWQELAVPSYDLEVAFDGERRLALQAVPDPLREEESAGQQVRPARISHGGTWVITGGARGITSHVAEELGRRFGLQLHLIGTAEQPQLSQQFREAARQDRLALRRSIMAQAAERNENGMEAWRNIEKAIEIDATLARCREAGISAWYHSCDVANEADLKETLEKIRQVSGPITGVLHGAGIGQDARFDRKRPDKVDQCFRAKIDGCINLMAACRNDPLEWFLSFGSISGRFGANGHTDYSCANDTLAKLVDHYRQQRPGVRSVCFHWHAWGDIGMATKPETKLALEMINLEFMPAREGLAHFFRELEFGGDEPEVLITDRAYYRKFFPVDRLSSPASSPAMPLLDPEGAGGPAIGNTSFAVKLHPEQELFLRQHLIQQKPTLPFVVALELMAEAARAVTGKNFLVEARNVEALQAIKWSIPESLTLAVQAQPADEGVHCEVKADIRRRDGRVVASDRTFFTGTLHPANSLSPRRSVWPDLSKVAWEPVEYPEPSAAVYHGPDLRCLRRFAIVDDQGYGELSASSTVQLGGGHRPVSGWSVHCAAMDACLYAAALFAGKRYGRASLPSRFGFIRWGRLPDPGEPCLVRIRRKSELPRGLLLAFEMIGLNGDLLLEVDDYSIVWLGESHLLEVC
jgi:NAD(P)-dependent dehydrogenase (short-subunit alcohol dehydrogenase family)